MFDSWLTFRRHRRTGSLETWSSGHSWIENARPAQATAALAEQVGAGAAATLPVAPVVGGTSQDHE